MNLRFGWPCLSRHSTSYILLRAHCTKTWDNSEYCMSTQNFPMFGLNIQQNSWKTSSPVQHCRVGLVLLLQPFTVMQNFHSFFPPSNPLEALCLLFFPPQNSCFKILRRLRVVTWVENLGFAIILHL